MDERLKFYLQGIHCGCKELKLSHQRSSISLSPQSNFSIVKMEQEERCHFIVIISNFLTETNILRFLKSVHLSITSFMEYLGFC
jgi:hypothetical protein